MDTSNGKEKREVFKKRKVREGEQYRLVISKEVNEVLGRMVTRTNEGFTGGEVTKSDIANLVLKNIEKSFSQNDILALRSLHFDEKRVLKELLRQNHGTEDLPEHLKQALRDHYGLKNQKPRAVKGQSSDPIESKIAL